MSCETWGLESGFADPTGMLGEHGGSLAILVLRSRKQNPWPIGCTRRWDKLWVQWRNSASMNKVGSDWGRLLPSSSGLHVHALTKANTHVHVPANTRHTNVFYVLSIFIQFPFKSLHYKSTIQQREKVASSKCYHTLLLTLLLADALLCQSCLHRIHPWSFADLVYSSLSQEVKLNTANLTFHTFWEHNACSFLKFRHLTNSEAQVPHLCLYT